MEVFDPLSRTLVLKFLWMTEDMVNNGETTRSIHIGDAHTLNRPGIPSFNYLTRPSLIFIYEASNHCVTSQLLLYLLMGSYRCYHLPFLLFRDDAMDHRCIPYEVSQPYIIGSCTSGFYQRYVLPFHVLSFPLCYTRQSCVLLED